MSQPNKIAVGFSYFAAIVMTVLGFSQIILGLQALVHDTYYVVAENWIFELDVTTWGWIHLILGALILIAGIFVVTGRVWARTVGVILAAVNAIVLFAWLPYYPVATLLLIALDLAIIWALTAHGRDIAETR